MLCKIADLIVEIPAAVGMAHRCQAYSYSGESKPDITIQYQDYQPQRYPKTISESLLCYLESGRLFHGSLYRFDGLYLHASALEVEGKAYLFSGPSGIGKSTHVGLWKRMLGNRVCRINDDKPTLRRLDGRWYAYGTPWCGKDGINVNKKVPLAGICFLKQGDVNRIRRLDAIEAVPSLLSRTIHRFENPDNLDLMLSHLDKLVQEIPIYELVNRPEIEAARLSYETMRAGAQEAGL